MPNANQSMDDFRGDHLSAKMFGASPAAPDNAAAIQSALTTAAAQDGELYLPAGVYSVGSELTIPSSVRVFGPGTIKATAAMSALVTMASVHLEGVILDGNGLAEHCLVIAGADGFNVDRVTLMGSTGETLQLGTPGAGAYHGRVTRCMIPDWADGANAIVGRRCEDVEIAHCVISSTGHTGQHGIGVIGKRILIHHNIIDGPQYGITSYLSIGLEIAHNIIRNCTNKAIWNDSDIAANTHHNLIEDCPDVAIEQEVCFAAMCHHNIIRRVGSFGVWAYGRDPLSSVAITSATLATPCVVHAPSHGLVDYDSVAVRCTTLGIKGLDGVYQVTVSGDDVTLLGSGATGTYIQATNGGALRKLNVDQLLLDNCESAWTGASGVTASTDSDKRVGSASAKLVLGGSTGPGVVAYHNLGSTITQAGSYPLLRIWIKASATVAAGALSFVLSDVTGASTPFASFPIPVLNPGEWHRFYLPVTASYYDMGATVSVGVVANVAVGPLTLWLDDVQMEAVHLCSSVADNTISEAGYQAINLDGVSIQARIESNHISGIGSSNKAGGSANAIGIDLNVCAVQATVTGNRVQGELSDGNPGAFQYVGIIDQGVGNTLIENEAWGFAYAFLALSVNSTTLRFGNRSNGQLEAAGAYARTDGDTFTGNIVCPGFRTDGNAPMDFRTGGTGEYSFGYGTSQNGSLAYYGGTSSPKWRALSDGSMEVYGDLNFKSDANIRAKKTNGGIDVRADGSGGYTQAYNTSGAGDWDWYGGGSSKLFTLQSVTNGGKPILYAGTGGSPVVLDSGKGIITDKIDLGSAAHVQATGLTTGNVPKWDGTKLVDSASSDFPDAMTAQNVVTGSRATGTTYHNAGSTPMFVTVTLSCTAVASTANFAQASALTDASNPPTTVVASTFNGSAANTVYEHLSFWVLPGNYYRITVATPTVTLISWVEWN